ncbi:MAG TPA: sigma-54 dependent transcriptional regulator [Vicinamibacterales bacterium]|nr:sigma-54 dependent transcriptional regulator [Vicinamibacterales bacterium]
MVKGRILVVDDEPGLRFALRAYLENCGYDVIEVATLVAAMEQLHEQVPDVALVDYALPDGNALDLLARIKSEGLGVPVVVLTGYGSIELAVTAVKEGAEQFLTKPVELASLALVVGRVIEHEQNSRRVAAVHSRQAPGEDSMFSGRSAAVRALAHEAQTAAACDAPILIEGETGTGKGRLARWIHAASSRAQESFVDLNCAGLPRDLLESELFGHEKGAFTGAVGSKPGLVEAAHRGTMFLDEVGDTDLAVQPKLLKIVEEKRFRRLGDVAERRVDVRFVAATNKSLIALVDEGKFREDLYYRINTLVLRLPPLRHRKGDIAMLADQIVQQLAREIGHPAPRIEADAIDALVAHSWPGNIRELRNVLERALLVTKSGPLRADDLRLNAGARRPAAATEMETLREVEWQHIQRVLAEEKGSVGRASKRLGIPRSSLYDKLKLRDERPASAV